MLKKLFVLNVILLILAQLTKTYIFSIYFFDLSMLVYALCGLVYFGKKLIIPKYLFIFVIFSCFTLVSAVYSRHNVSFESVSYLIRWLAYLMSALVTYNLIKEKKLNEEFVFKAILYSAVFLALGGFYQLIFLPDFTVLEASLGWDPHKYRLASTFYDPNFAGCYFVLSLTILLYKFKSEKYYYSILSLLLLSLLLTYSRSAWGMFVIVIMLFGLKRSAWYLFLALALAFMAYFAVPRIQTRLNGITDPADSASLRLISWQETLSIIEDNFVFGIGFNAMKAAKIDYGYINPDTLSEHSASGSDSSLLLVFATTGIIGLVIFISAFLFPLLDYPSFFKMAVIGGLLLESQFINSLFYPQIMFIWLILYALFDIKTKSNYFRI